MCKYTGERRKGKIGEEEKKVYVGYIDEGKERERLRKKKRKRKE